MSILIKGMKMPSGCISCDLCNTFTDEPYCRRLMRKTPKVTRLKDCPLVEVPTPHGRLIDEAYISQVEWYTEDGICIVNAGEFETDAPTIIEAEEGEGHDV